MRMMLELKPLLKLSKCLGPDEISPKIVKMSVDSTSKALSLILNRSLLHREIPVNWKNANVVRIFLKRVQWVITIIIDQLV